ncbi:hypothetical protein [Bacillus toyonensis]|uniref:hypothetical protein n=1 Tax=Bacillus toyonensis TaxID=155322 RepID=UPI00159B9212|nr:hypothetical protein [Bacillus toyonensis]
MNKSVICIENGKLFGHDNSNGKNGYGGLYCTHWGWSEEGMKKMREYAREIGYLKVS